MTEFDLSVLSDGRTSASKHNKRSRLPKDPRYVRITSGALGHNLLLLMGETQPTVIDGEGGWNVVARPDSVGMTDWSGVNPYLQTIDFLLDRKDETGQGVRPRVHRLRKLAKPNFNHNDPAPPRMRVYGKGIPVSGRQWVIQSLSWGETRRTHNGALVRQQVTVAFLKYTEPDSIRVKKFKHKHGGKHGGGKAQRYTVKKGDTLMSIARKFYDDHKKWHRIAKRNSIKNPRRLKVGTKLIIP